MLLINNLVSYHGFKNVDQNCCLSCGHDREKGGECHGNEYECHGNEYTPFSNGIFMFLWENTFISWFLMMSLCYITNDIIDLFSKL